MRRTRWTFVSAMSAGIAVIAAVASLQTKDVEARIEPSRAARSTQDEPVLAFSRGLLGRGSSIYVTGAKGSHERQLTYQPGFSFEPEWSPDGRYLAYSYDPPLNRPAEPSTILTMQADGTRRTDVGARMGLGSVTSPAWSPNGRMLAFVALTDNSMWGTLYVAHRDGSVSRRVTGPELEARSPHWAPDGKRIVVTCGRNQNTSLCVIRLSDGRVQYLTRPGAWANIERPTWAASGLVVFSALGRQASDSEIYSLRPGTNSGVQLVTDSRAAAGDSPSVASDGRIAFDCGQGRAFGVCAVRADGSGLTRIIDDASLPSWRP